MMGDEGINRRAFGGAVAAAGLALSGRRLLGQGPAVMPAEGARPSVADGVASGDVGGRSAVVWSRTDRPAQPAPVILAPGVVRPGGIVRHVLVDLDP